MVVLAIVNVFAMAQARDLYEDKNKFELEEATAKYLAQQQARLNKQWHPAKASGVCATKFTADVDKSGQLSNISVLRATRISPKTYSIAKLMAFPPPPVKATPLRLYLYFFGDEQRKFVTVGSCRSDYLPDIYPNGENPIVTRQNPSRRDGDFGPYLENVVREMAQAWRHPDLTTKGCCEITFDVDRSGTVSNLRITSSSGSPRADHSAIQTIKDASPLRSPPVGIPDRITLSLKFDKNLIKNGWPHLEPDQGLLKPE